MVFQTQLKIISSVYYNEFEAFLYSDSVKVTSKNIKKQKANFSYLSSG